MNSTENSTTAINLLVTKVNELIEHTNETRKELVRQNIELQKLRLKADLLIGASDSSSQFQQDLFALKETKYKRNGFFVEFGATNGIEGSNSYLLENNYEWNGILAEPARFWISELQKNRKAIIDTRCVWTETGAQIDFLESDVPTLSTMSSFTASDFHANLRAAGKFYSVETVSLLDLLAQHNAPPVIDYLSIDTEGSELAILSAFDFSKYDIRIISCEHNWTPDRKKINELLVSKGYELKHRDLTDCDDWYVKIATTS